MVTVDQANIVKLKTHGQNFEILVDSNAAIAFRGNNNMDIRDVLAVQKVFSDAKKGLEAPENQMKLIFQTADPLEVAKMIIQKGEIPLTKEYKENLRETKKRQIIDIIHRNAVDPQTHPPHPPARIEAAMAEAGYHVDEFKEVQKQVQDVLKIIRPILPIKFEVKEIATKIPPEFAAKSYPIFNQFGKKIREDWQTDGSLVVVIEMPGGLEEDFHNKLNALCHGNVETKVLKVK